MISIGLRFVLVCTLIVLSNTSLKAQTTDFIEKLDSTQTDSTRLFNKEENPPNFWFSFAYGLPFSNNAALNPAEFEIKLNLRLFHSSFFLGFGLARTFGTEQGMINRGSLIIGPGYNYTGKKLFVNLYSAYARSGTAIVSGFSFNMPQPVDFTNTWHNAIDLGYRLRNNFVMGIGATHYLNKSVNLPVLNIRLSWLIERNKKPQERKQSLQS
jgi:hypothetical protein